MNLKIKYLKNIYLNNDDLIFRELYTVKNKKVYVVFFESLCNSLDIYEYIIRRILETKENIKLYKLISGPKIKKINTNDEMQYYLENSYTLVIYKDDCYAVEVKAELDRGITPSSTEPNMYGPKDAFCENYQKNLGLIKRRIKFSGLKIKSIELGDITKTKLSFIYKENNQSNEIVKKLEQKFTNLNLNIIDSENLCKILNKKSLFPSILKTEKPAIASKFILNNNIVLLIDNSPFVLVIDAKLKDFINPSTTDFFIKILRYVCFFLTIFTPAIYISLINFNQETIPPSLLISFSEQRSSVPFPAVVEATIMLFICELLRETDIRFPSTYGSAASILGALILGDAAVNAGIVSPIMIIIIAITFITNLIFTDITFVRGIRISRYINLLIASFLGLYGLNISIILILGFLYNTKMYNGDYV